MHRARCCLRTALLLYNSCKPDPSAIANGCQGSLQSRQEPLVHCLAAGQLLQAMLSLADIQRGVKQIFNPTRSACRLPCCCTTPASQAQAPIKAGVKQFFNPDRGRLCTALLLDNPCKPCSARCTFKQVSSNISILAGAAGALPCCRKSPASHPKVHV